MHLSMAVNSKHISKYVCGTTLCAMADATRQGKLSALPPRDQRRSEAIATDTIRYAQANIWVRNICMCWPCRRDVYLYGVTKGQRVCLQHSVSLEFAGAPAQRLCCWAAEQG